MIPELFDITTLGNLNSCYRYIGSFEDTQSLPMDAKIGDICICDNYTYIFCGDFWEQLEKLEKLEIIDESDEKTELTEMKCKNCGATLKKIDKYHYRCEYCGSTYEYK